MIKNSSALPGARHLSDTIPLDSAALSHPLDVFLVEDEGFIRERVMSTLERIDRVNVVGYAESAPAAEQMLKDLQCDLIILDLELTEGTGFHVLRTVRARSGRQPWIVVFTHFNDPHFRKQTLELGADFFLDKAQDLDRLADIIKRLPPPG